MNDVQLMQLLPNTAYSISLFALHGEAASEPLIDRGVTCTLVSSLFSDGFILLFLIHSICFYKSNASISLLVPLPPSGKLKISEVTHSSMRLIWDAAPGNVRKYIITYKREDGELKEVIKMCNTQQGSSKSKTQYSKLTKF